MWIFTKHGFFSAVCARKGNGKHGQPVDPDRIMVRGRLRSHLKALKERFPDLLGECDIQETAGTDYAFRLFVPKPAWVQVLAGLAEETDYDNFKSEVANHQGEAGAALRWPERVIAFDEGEMPHWHPGGGIVLGIHLTDQGWQLPADAVRLPAFHITLIGRKVFLERQNAMAKAWESLDANPFADWSAHLFVADRTRYIIVSNTKSLYSALMCAKGITNAGHFIERALSSIREFMEADGQQFTYRRFIAPVSGTGRFAKALDRTVTGSMNELITHATAMLAEGEMSLHDVAFSLNDVLLSSLAPSKSKKYGKPGEAFKNLLNETKQKRATS